MWNLAKCHTPRNCDASIYKSKSHRNAVCCSVPFVFGLSSGALLAEYYGQSENHFFKCAYENVAILQTWKPFCKVAPITVICPLFKKLFPFLKHDIHILQNDFQIDAIRPYPFDKHDFHFWKSGWHIPNYRFHLSSARKHLDEA